LSDKDSQLIKHMTNDELLETFNSIEEGHSFLDSDFAIGNSAGGLHHSEYLELLKKEIHERDLGRAMDVQMESVRTNRVALLVTVIVTLVLAVALAFIIVLAAHGFVALWVIAVGVVVIALAGLPTFLFVRYLLNK
jgi:hypothetical protein